LGIDVAWYSQETTDDIVDQTISRATGFSSTKINVGRITNKGYEVMLTGSPVEEHLVGISRSISLITIMKLFH
jgi:hypothetical protein